MLIQISFIFNLNLSDNLFRRMATQKIKLTKGITYSIGTKGNLKDLYIDFGKIGRKHKTLA